MNSPARRQSSSAGSGTTGCAAIAARSCFSRSMRSISEGSTHVGMTAAGPGGGAAGAGGTGAGGGGGGGMGEGIAVRDPVKGTQALPSKRHFPSSDTASFQRSPSQNQLRSGDQPGDAAVVAI